MSDGTDTPTSDAEALADQAGQSVSTDEKREILRQASRTFGKLLNLELELQVREETDHLAKVRQASKMLMQVTDRLRAAIAREWTTQVSGLCDRLSQTNTDIQTKIREIRNMAEVPTRIAGILESVSQITGTLDKLV